jgi:hypothetical protein
MRWHLTWFRFGRTIVGSVAIFGVTLAVAVLLAHWKPAKHQHDAFLLSTVESFAMIQSKSRPGAIVLIILPDGSKATVGAGGYAAILSLESEICVERRIFDSGGYRYSRTPRENCVED